MNIQFFFNNNKIYIQFFFEQQQNEYLVFLLKNLTSCFSWNNNKINIQFFLEQQHNDGKFNFCLHEVMNISFMFGQQNGKWLFVIFPLILIRPCLTCPCPRLFFISFIVIFMYFNQSIISIIIAIFIIIIKRDLVWRVLVLDCLSYHFLYLNQLIIIIIKRNLVWRVLVPDCVLQVPDQGLLL